MERLARLVAPIKRLSPKWWRIARLTYLRRGHSDVNTMAAAIGFYALICIGPLGLLMAWSLQFVTPPGTSSYEWLRNTVNRMAGETAGAIMGEIDALISNPNTHVAGIFGALVLIWAGLRLFEALEIGLTDIWPGGKARGLVARKLTALVTMIASGLLLIIVILLTAFLPSVINWISQQTAVDAGEIIPLQSLVIIAAEVTVAFAAFFLLFKYIPVQEVTSRVAAVGALFTALAWRAITPIFTMTVAESAGNSAVYGGLAGVVVFLTWAFFGAHVLLLGAHFAAAYEHVVTLNRPESLDDSFIRLRAEQATRPTQREEQEREDFYGPQAYPPPGHV